MDKELHFVVLFILLKSTKKWDEPLKNAVFCTNECVKMCEKQPFF